MNASLSRRTAPVVTHCYDLLDCLFPETGLLDLTEGIYHGDPSLSIEEAQANQINWLLDQCGCGPGTRLLDIGCGNGTLVEAACRRGAEAIGITISPPQMRRCRDRGLDVRLLNYRDIGDQWDGYFDAIVANGSAEHFVQPDDVLAGRADAIYRDLFRLCHRLTNPQSPSGRFVTTIIHSNEFTPQLDPAEMTRSPFAFRPFSPKFHYALLQRGFGGFYPAPGQLARCASPYYRLAEEVDGTEDYRLTSEAWFRRIRSALFSLRHGPRMWRRLSGRLLRHPFQSATLLFCLLAAESWQRQFRGPHPPTTLWRQTWNYCPQPTNETWSRREQSLQPVDRLSHIGRA